MDTTEFDNELSTLADRLPVTASKISLLTTIATRNVANCQKIVDLVTKYAKSCPPDAKLAVVYVIDSICRQTQRMSLDVFQKAFESILPQLMQDLSKCSDSDKDKMKVVIDIWKTSTLFSNDCIDQIHNNLRTPNNQFKITTESPSALNAMVSNLQALAGNNTAVKDKQVAANDPRHQFNQIEPQKLNDQSNFDAVQSNQLMNQLMFNVNQTAIQSIPSMNSNLPQMNVPSIPPNVTLANLQQLNSAQNQNIPPMNPNQIQMPNIQQLNPMPNMPQVNPLMPNIWMGQPQMPPNMMMGGIDNQTMLNLAALLSGAQAIPQLNNLVALLGAPLGNQQMPMAFNNENSRSDRSYDSHGRDDNRDRHKDRRDYDDDRRDSREARDRRKPKKDNKRGEISLDKPVGPGPDCVASYSDPSVPSDSIKFMSRTLFISDVSPTLNAIALRELLEKYARIETVRLNPTKNQAFVKVATRKEAENIRSFLGNYRIGNHILKIGWGCGYGPREHFNYTEGFTMFPIDKIPVRDRSVIENCPPRGGGPILGGTVAEEPNVPIDVALQSRGNPLAPRQGLVMPPRIEQKIKRERGDGESQSEKRAKYD